MLMSRRKSTDMQNALYTKEIYMQGFLKKSPPMELFAKQSSWKKRFFVLVKVTNKVYYLKYYTSQNQLYKGEIPLEDVKSVCYGVENQERMPAIPRIFSCSPELVIILATEKRDYYLIGESRTQVDEWFDALSNAWAEVQMDAEPKTCSAIASVTEEARGRSSSCPVAHTTMAIEYTEEEMQGAALRPQSDPFPAFGSIRPRHPPPQWYCPKSMESKRLSEESNSTDESGIYDVPNPNLKCVFCSSDNSTAIEALRNLQCVHCCKKSTRASLIPSDIPQYEYSDSEEDEDEDEDDEGCNGTYEPMDPIRLSFHTYANIPYASSLADSKDHAVVRDECDGKTESEMIVCLSDPSPLSSPGLDEQRISEPSTQSGGNLSRHSHSFERVGGKKKKSTPSLSHGRLLRLYGCRDQSQFKELNISLPKEAASTHMGLLEVEDKICVSKWNGPENLGYPFHFGDHILAVNDIEVKSRGDVLKNISMVRSEKVNITILRVPNSVILNTE